MRLEPTADQLAFADAVDAVLRHHVTPAALHARRDGGALDRDLWDAVAHMGVLGSLVPEESGGLALSFADLVVVLERFGVAAAPVPVLETAVVVAPLLAACPGEAARETLESVLDGRAVASAVLREEDSLAADADVADVLAIVGDRPLVGTRRSFDIELQTSFDPCRRVGRVGAVDAWQPALDISAVERLRDRVLVANAALVLGVSQQLLDVSVDYARQRRQFGRTIGSFQAVKHMLAEVHLELVSGRAAVLAAAVLDEEGSESERSVAARVAAAHMTEAALRTNHVALQVHGGIGYTWEYDLQLWLKLGLVLARRLGPASTHRRMAAQLAGLLEDAS